jgi:hypothetical protein
MLANKLCILFAVEGFSWKAGTLLFFNFIEWPPSSRRRRKTTLQMETTKPEPLQGACMANVLHRCMMSGLSKSEGSLIKMSKARPQPSNEGSTFSFWFK